MKPPRRPRGEKPQTTIRLLRRHILTLEQELAHSRELLEMQTSVVEERDKTINNMDRRIAEIEDSDRMAGVTIDHSFGRHHFLEGYFYALEHSKANGGAGKGNHRDSSDGTAHAEKGWEEGAAARTAPETRR